MADRFDWDKDGLGRLYLLGVMATAEITREIADDMRRTVPIDTGLRPSTIEDVMVDDTGVISVGTEYWEFVEYGTSRMDAQPFIRPALYRKRRA